MARFGKNVKMGRRTVIADNVHFGDNVVVDHFVIIGADCIIGSNVVLKQRVTLARGTWIGDNVFIGPNVVTLADQIKGKTTTVIREGSFIGAQSVILKDISIGKDVMIGAMSLVNRDCADGCSYAGVPIKQMNLKKENV